MQRTTRGYLFALAATSLFCACSATPEASDSLASSAQELSDCACPAGVPAAINPAADQTIKSSLQGIGVQIYMCNATATGFAWTFVAPQANLYNDDGKLVGTHFIGPTWQANDGSTVVAARAAGATVDASAIPWLLLNATSHASVEGRFSDVTSIQRLSTVGGIAPTTPCDGSNLGSIAQVPYSAQYVLYKAKAHGKVSQCSGS